MKNKLKLRPELFLKAAELIDRAAQSYACHAIRQAAIDSFGVNSFVGGLDIEKNFFNKLYCPKNAKKTCAYFTPSQYRGGGEAFNPQRLACREHRVMALLLAYHVSKDENK